MSENTLPVITIEREYAAGGRSVAKLLAEKLDIPWYDYDFIIQAALNSGLSIEEIMKDGEELSSGEKILDTILGTSDLYASMHDKVFYAQREVIIKLAQKPCIIIGRASDAICKEAAIKSFNVYLYNNDEEQRRIHAEALDENTKDVPIEKYIEKRDKARNNFYKTYTGKDLNDPSNYDICLNTVIGFEKCAEILENIVKSY